MIGCSRRVPCFVCGSEIVDIDTIQCNKEQQSHPPPSAIHPMKNLLLRLELAPRDLCRNYIW